MKVKKTIIIFESYHHKNTEVIGRIIAQSLQAKLFKPDQLNVSILSGFNLIGFGTGIYNGKPHEKIQLFLEQLPSFEGKKAFLFITSGMLRENYSKGIEVLIRKKGLQLIGSFSCKGFNNHGTFKIIGGKNRGHPDLQDFYHAEIFANGLKNRL
jgi:flavodoxin